MDFNKLTVKSQEAIAAAQEDARRRGNPEIYPEHLLLALLDQDLPRELVPDAEELRAESGGEARRQAVAPGRGPAADRLDRVLARPRPRRGGDAQARGRVHLDRAPAARARRRPTRRAARAAQGSPRRPARHLPESRRHLPGAGEVRARPDRARRAGQARPGHRPRRGSPPRDPGALAAHEEQPGADRRAGSGEDRDRRGPRPADRRRRRARGPEGQAGVGARHRRAPRRLEISRRVRGADQGRARRDQELGGRDRALHRRAAHDCRRGRGRGRGRRGEPAEADALARRVARDRSNDPRRVSQAHREGRGTRAALPTHLRRRAVRHGHDRDPARAQGALRSAPRRAHP